MTTVAGGWFRTMFDRSRAQRPGRTEELANRAVDLMVEHQRTGRADVLEEAVGAARAALAVTPDDHPHRGAVSDILALALLGVHERTGDMAALEEAVEEGRRALATVPRDDPRRAGVASNHGMTLRSLFESTGRPEVLDEAIETGRLAVAAAAEADPDRPQYLGNLATALLARFESTGRIEALEEGIATGRRAMAAAPDGSPYRAALSANLAPALRRQYECTGRVEVLEESIGAARQALTAVAPGDPKRAGVVANLGMALVRMFERTGQTALLEEAIDGGRQALRGTAHNSRQGVVVLNLLHCAYLRLFDRTGSDEALEEAIETGRQMLAVIPSGHRGRADLLASLGVAQRLLFERTDRVDVLVEAIETGRRSVADSPLDHPNRPDNYANLSNSLLRLFQRNGRVDVLEESIEKGRMAVAVSPLDQPKRAMHLYSLGAALNDLYDRTGSVEALHEACRYFGEAGAGATGEAFLRYMAHRRFAQAAIARGTPDAALRAIEEAVELLTAVLPSDLARSDREHRIGRLPGLAAEAVAAALAAGRPERAVELLERTRGVLAADAHSARGPDMVRLRGYAPHLADELERLRVRLGVPDAPTASVPLPDQEGPPATVWEARRQLAEDRRDAYEEWRRLLDRIRGLPGFSGFFQAPGIEELVHDAQGARVVFVVVGALRCDALILPESAGQPVEVLPLTSLTQDTAMEYTNRMFAAVNAANDPELDPVERVRAQQEIFSVLAWMWDTITEPVLTHLGHVAKPGPGEDWPRVRWCPVGFLAYLPLHAAGYHVDDPERTAAPRAVMDRVVSSYTTTIRALARQPETGGRAAVIVPVAEIPGAAPLPAVPEETTDISALVADAQVLTPTTRDVVLRALPEYRIAHFACHGSSGWADPAQSCLLLSDYETEPLTIRDIGALGLNADLAYLSACYTSVTSPLLVDESLHITGAFQLAGYRHVIGTLWQVTDRPAADLARDFYTHLTDGGTVPPQAHRTPQALHHAVRSQRARYPHTPTLWAAHTHTGA
ncbi:CHAT domain-containing protein [Streptomyces sp. NPDC059524]|uniref:CHAT domain-containing protein n=1 Tax=Streptomyces sp. NPDC059524 TaxID=3346856 RepID=UPI0036B50E78